MKHVQRAYRYWSRTLTGAEFLVEAIIAINVGAKGSVSWNDSTTPDIKTSASLFAKCAARPHALLVIIPADIVSCQLHSCRHAWSAGLQNVGIRRREDTRDGYEFEQRYCQYLGERGGFLCQSLSYVVLNGGGGIDD